MARKPKPAKPKEKGRGLVWIMGLACLGCVAVAPAACGMLAVLLAPAIVALLLDKAPGRPVGRAMVLCGSAACVGPVVIAWQTGFGGFTDPIVFGPSWAACAAGWLGSQLLPIGVRALIEAASVTRAARLRAEREKLSKAWGIGDQ